ncbi:MAG: hypothetical protein GWN71_26990 [Gammaproteobacteria bacterium]|nr:hypothetical protein [Gemmatimonadota bacterium]NIU77067.1 hypothetical protein [Gammaproteobacteria bacterium]
MRAHAYAVIREAAAHGWSPRAELFYEVPLAFPDFESFRARLIAADESRRSAVEAMEAGLRAGFERLADREAGRYEFRQPVRANLLASEARS